ncbi:MAG TPA: glycosyltransferase family 2 protein [Cytophagaceae bacterium]
MKKEVYPLVSIITINYNNAKVTCELLESLKHVTYPNLEILVVDNASLESPNIIKDQYPFVNLICSDKNLGFAGGNNLGFINARGKYFLMLNNDTEVDAGFLEPLVEKMESDDKIGAVGSKIIYYHSKDTIQYAGGESINPYTGRGSFVGKNEKDKGQYNFCSPTPFTHGAAMMVSRKVIENIGMMADIYFLYYEELDFCERIKRAGYTIWYVGASVVYHKESMTIGKENPVKVYYMTRNRLVFMRRNVKGLKLLSSMLFFSLASVPKNTFKYLLQKRFDLLKAFYKGYTWNWVNKDIHENPSIKITQL